MERAVESGLEVKVPTNPEVATHTDGGGESNENVLRPRHQSVQSQVQSKTRYVALWVLAIVAVVCLAVALGAGLGVGLAAQHKSSTFV